MTPGWRDPPRPDVIGFFHVAATGEGNFWCHGAWLMTVHPKVFIPANNPNELALIDQMVEQNYQFSRVLSLEKPARRNTLDWVVRHVAGPDGNPVAKAMLDLQDNGLPKDAIERRREVAQRYAAKGVPVWTWRMKGEHLAWKGAMPPLPPLTTLDKEKIHARLQSIRELAQLSYLPAQKA
jgi:hypothetical protein